METNNKNNNIATSYEQYYEEHLGRKNTVNN